MYETNKVFISNYVLEALQLIFFLNIALWLKHWNQTSQPTKYCFPIFNWYIKCVKLFCKGTLFSFESNTTQNCAFNYSYAHRNKTYLESRQSISQARTAHRSIFSSIILQYFSPLYNFDLKVVKQASINLVWSPGHIYYFTQPPSWNNLNLSSSYLNPRTLSTV